MIAQYVETARKAKAPIVGIPIPGERPFCISRRLLVDTLKNLMVIDAAIQLPLDPKGKKMLVVYASGSNVQAIRKFYPMPDWSPDHIRIPLANWANSLRKKRATPKLSAHQREITRLQKRLAKLGTPKPPKHPLLYPDHWHESLLEYDARQLKACVQMRDEGSYISLPLTLGQQWAQFKREAPVRRWIQAQARECAAGKINTTTLYARLRDRGLTVRKWSELSTHERDTCETAIRRTIGGNGQFGYLNRLWEFCSCSRKPTYWFDQPDHYDKPGREHYEAWLEHLHAYKELQSMIASLKELS